MSQPAQAHAPSGWPPEQSLPLNWDDLDAVSALVSHVAPGWSVELNQTCAEDSSIVVLPEGANDLLGPAFVLHRSLGRVRLDQFRWDEYRKLGAFATLDDALADMRTRLAPLVGTVRPRAALNH